MRNLLYFNPDPSIPDSDVLGFGDLIYDDNTSEYLSGDAELAAMLPMQPMGPPEAQQAPEMPPPIDLGGGLSMDMLGNISQGGQPIQGAAPGEALGVQDPQTGELLSPGQPSAFLPALGAELGNAAQGYPEPIGAGWERQMGGQQSPGLEPQGGPPGAPQPQILDLGGTMVELSPTGDMRPAPPGAQPTQQQQPGMVPYERQGALPPELAQQQLGAMQAQQQSLIGATQQARGEETRLYNDLVLKQMAANDVERMQREQDIAEQQAKMERWQQEQQATLDMQIEQDLVSARGGAGAAFAAIGAALLGAAGNDVGFRMIENSIDRHVRQQVARRDTKLHMLSQQIGSAQQAIAMGKAALYKVAAERTELLAAKTKSDVYEAQTPMVVEQLKQKALEQYQQAEQLSLGKLIERAPPPPKPPSPEALQKYGELRRERDASNGLVQRVEQQLGLLWEPGRNGQAGHYQNAQEVLDRGVQGIGELEQWVPDFVYSTLGQQEGIQVRGAAEALAYAQIRQMQPTGPISNADIQAAVKAGALQTEEGMLRGLERMRTHEEQQALHDQSQYGPDVVRSYEQQFRSSGGQPLRAPAPSRPATHQDVRRELGGAPALQQQGAMAEDPQERAGMLAESLTSLGQEKGIPPEGIQILMAQAAHETGDFRRMPQNNYFGMKSSGRNRAEGAGSANLETTEGQGGDARRVRQDFATFATPADAAADMLSLLERRYPLAMEALQVGDVDAYVAALADRGYFTGNEQQYLQGMLRRL